MSGPTKHRKGENRRGNIREILKGEKREKIKMIGVKTKGKGRKLIKRIKKKEEK